MQGARTDRSSDWKGYGLAIVVTALATVVSGVMARHIALTNLVMIYLLGVTYVASHSTPRAAVFASLLGVATFDFCFVPPSGTLAVADVEYVFTFAVMLAVSLLISTLTARLREQSKARTDAALHIQVEQMRSDLLSGVSHDLRTPLASIEGSAGALLQQPELAEQSRQLATTIQDESIRMARLIRNLLDMTRVQGKIDLDLDWYGVDELVANAILRTEGLFENPVSVLAPAEAPLLRVDGVLIEQVFVNLLENAARHAGRSAQVVIEVVASNKRVMVAVTDDGPGIDPAMQSRLFERFQGTSGAGTGLGLAICRAAVEAHGGTITASNPKQGGARFTIDLPLGEEAPSA